MASKKLFIAKSKIDAPAAEVFRWHEEPDTLERLTPPWEPVELEQRPAVVYPQSLEWRVQAGGGGEEARVVLGVAVDRGQQPERRRAGPHRQPQGLVADVVQRPQVEGGGCVRHEQEGIDRRGRQAGRTDGKVVGRAILAQRLREDPGAAGRRGQHGQRQRQHGPSVVRGAQACLVVLGRENQRPLDLLRQTLANLAARRIHPAAGGAHQVAPAHQRDDRARLQ